MSKIIIAFILSSLISINCIANQSFKVVVGLSKPPYVNKENLSGFELELIHHILFNIGKKPEFIFIPYDRSEKMFELPGIDAVLSVNEQLFPNSKTLSNSYINYQNVAISLKRNDVLLNNIRDIGNYSIASFQLAHKVLGEEFASAVASSPMFIQVANEEKQVDLLLLGRIDIIVMDIKIFLYYLNKLNMSEKKSDIQFHYIFPISPSKIAFKNSDDVNAFNQAMKKYKMTNNYQKLIEKYNF